MQKRTVSLCKLLQFLFIIRFMAREELKPFGKRLKELRKERKLTQAILAEKLDLSPNFIGMVERGERNIALDKIIKLSKALNISLAQFFETL